MAPLRTALAVLDGRGAIAVPRSGLQVKYKPSSWLLNSGDGMKLGDIGTLYASMAFKVIDTDPAQNEFSKGLRVTTLSYNYKLQGPDGVDRWRMHWHPDGLSDTREPHLHIQPDLKMHHPCDRMTFETAIRWCMKAGAPLTCTLREAEDELIAVEAPHKLHCSWTSRHDRPDLINPPVQ